MDRLIRCHECGHGAILHGAAGCAVDDCACPAQKQQIVDREIVLARRDITMQWRPSPHESPSR